MIFGLVVIIAACGGPPFPALSDLKALPEAGLAPPGAAHVSRNERDSERTIEGPVPAILGDVMATTLEREAVFDFYEAEFADRGYTRDDKDLANIRTTIEHELRVWRKGDVVARVAFLRVGDVRVPAVPAGIGRKPVRAGVDRETTRRLRDAVLTRAQAEASGSLVRSPE